MKKVKVYKYTKNAGDMHMTKVEDGNAKFHQFGVDYEEFESGGASFSTAIIEREDGTIENVPVEMIKFIGT